MLGQITNGKNLHLPDLSFREMAVFAPLIAWAIWIGIYPKPYFDILEKPVAQIVERVRPGYYAAELPPQRSAPQRPPSGRPHNEPVLHRQRPFRAGAGHHAGALRLRHPAARHLDHPQSQAAQISAARLRDPRPGAHRLLSVAPADVPRRDRRVGDHRVPGNPHHRRLSLCSSTGSSCSPR